MQAPTRLARLEHTLSLTLLASGRMRSDQNIRFSDGELNCGMGFPETWRTKKARAIIQPLWLQLFILPGSPGWDSYRTLWARAA